MEKEFKRVYVGPSNVHTVSGVGGPFETGEVVTIPAGAPGILSEKHFDESFPGIFEKPGSELGKKAIAAREKLLKARNKEAGVEALTKVADKAAEKKEAAEGGKE